MFGIEIHAILGTIAACGSKKKRRGNHSNLKQEAIVLSVDSKFITVLCLSPSQNDNLNCKVGKSWRVG